MEKKELSQEISGKDRIIALEGTGARWRMLHEHFVFCNSNPFNLACFQLFIQNKSFSLIFFAGNFSLIYYSLILLLCLLISVFHEINSKQKPSQLLCPCDPGLDVPESKASEILKYVSQTSRMDGSSRGSATFGGAQTAWAILSEEKFLPCITTSCLDLDNILGGGIRCREVTEIGGVPGIGKTQIGIQLAVNVQIPIEYGGLGGQAIYIDTEGSFMVERVLQIAEACMEDLSECGHLPKDAQDCKVKMHPNNILQNIFYFRVCSYTEQIALVNYLDKFVTEHKSVKIIILDSVTFHFRQEFDDMARRTRLLSEMALKFMKLSKKFGLAVVMLNQVTTKLIDGSFQLTLALGDSWSHMCTNRIILYWNNSERYAFIDKSPSLKSASASYSVTSGGIRNSSSSSKRIKMM